MRSLKSLFRITPGLRNKHDYRQDKAHDGRYLRRLPDRTLVPAEEYEERLQEFEANLENSASARDSD